MAQVKTIPSLEGFREISTAQRDEFRNNGHVRVRGVLSTVEVAVYRQQVVEAVKRQSREKRRLPEKGIYGRAFGQMVNLWRHDEGVRQLVLSKRLGKVAADLLGVANVRIYHDHALFKEAGGGATYWHQDQYYWPLDTADTVTMAMALTDQSIEMGMFVFATGSHKYGTIMDPKLSSEPDSTYRKYIREQHFPLSRAAGMRAGDATWHYGNTVHHTSANLSDRRREMMTITYMADGARVAQPVHPAQVNELNMWLSGLPPGRLAMSDLNPLIL
ncbi:phytanoyl-CoA dioxygenase family protein [Puia dinghuensis]|uniref:Phytanoyl-CoA dioxygenase n=1 Tax=Puia dinghuensis TaxID=1792502 RepID=A0A8J2UGZ9_9BACT|nr:phytanoyl-CoA dioxygenase family protein [Puia dinghuensis]GGB16757.1 phytanoyl-CoA dioxygenase [Puia dinghuensis]